MNYDCDEAEQRCEATVLPRCYGFPLEESGGPEIFQALWKPMFELSALCHTVVSRVGFIRLGPADTNFSQVKTKPQV